MDQVVQLRSTPRPMALTVDDIYFAFPSGRLSYDCVTCNASCCRGHGYELGSGSEVLTQLTKRPSLRVFLERRPSASAGFLVSNCAPACFFLRSDGRCEIHATAGHDAKPETCRLFPFNNLRLVGNALVVAPHPSLCPLNVTPPGVTAALSDHRELFAELQRWGVSATIAQGALGNLDAGDAIRLERRVAASAAEHVDRHAPLAFLAEQLAFASATTTSTAAEAAIRDALAIQRTILSIDQNMLDAYDTELAAAFIAIVPALRTSVLFPRPSEIAAGAHALTADRVPLVLLALWTIARAARDAGLDRVTLQSLLQMFRAFQPLAEVLSFVSSPVSFAHDATFDALEFKDVDGRMAFVRLVRALMPRHQSRRRAPLGTLLLEFAPKDPLARISFLKQAARQLGRKLIPLEGAEQNVPDRRSRRDRMRAATQRFVLSYLPEQSLEWAYRTARSPSG